MKTAGLLSVAVVAVLIPLAGAFEEPKRTVPLAIELPKELADQGWTIVPEVPGTPVGKGIKFIIFENRKLERNVLTEEKRMKRTHAEVVLCILEKAAMPGILEKWDADYEQEMKEYRAFAAKTPGTSLARPRHQAGKLFWQTDDYVLLVNSETGGPEEESLKTALKRQLIGK